ncbi:tetratricopeptide repeat protein [Methylopila musalis]|uniref:Tetratricopeptide repeat protein n=1 Tax=Methylopila musalis TaxID=1134781 RepID=A0ABW3Z5D0_9HYPH
MLSAKIPAERGSPLEDAIAAYNREDFDAAFQLFQGLANAGDAEAKTWLGVMYAHGEGCAASPQMAFALYLAAAEAGNALAQTNVGAMLAMGQGVERDERAAVAWLTRAAEQGDLYAQYNLATLLSKPNAQTPSAEAAAGWYRKAAEGGHYPSQARLGFLYANGVGVQKDRVEAYVWLSLAAQHGVGSALNALEGVVGQMSADEKRAGAAGVARWRAATPDVSMHARLSPVPG